MEELRTNVAKAEATRERVRDAYDSGDYDKAQMRVRLAMVDKDAAGWEDELRRLEAAAQQRETTEEVGQRAQAIASRIGDFVGELTLTERKELIRAAVEMVTVRTETDLSIDGMVPADTDKLPSGTQLSR